MKILLVSSSDPKNIHSWSGTTKNIFMALNNIASEQVSFHSTPVFMKILSKLFLIVTRKKGDFYKTKIYSKFLANKIEKIIKKEKPDIVIGVAATVELAHIKTTIPIIHISDATYLNLYNYHPNHLKIWGWSKKSANDLEQCVIDNADYVVLPTQWASQSALEDYHCAQQKINTFPLGANLPMVSKMSAKAPVGIDKPCKLLFVGVDWKYKGGDIAFATMLALRHKGIDAKLQVIGCVPPSHISSTYMEVTPNLDKHKPSEFQELIDHFSDSTFLVVPTLSEAFGIVFAEAAMFGLPSISYYTGGVTCVIDHEITGHLLPVGSSGSEFADVIESIIADDAKYQQMSKDSYAKYKNELNWQTWQNDMQKLIARCLNQTS